MARRDLLNDTERRRLLLHSMGCIFLEERSACAILPPAGPGNIFYYFRREGDGVKPARFFKPPVCGAGTDQLPALSMALAAAFFSVHQRE